MYALLELILFSDHVLHSPINLIDFIKSLLPFFVVLLDFTEKFAELLLDRIST